MSEKRKKSQEKQRSEDIIKEIVEKTNWRFVSVLKLIDRLGYIPTDELNKLYKEGKIKVHDGINAKVIEYVGK